MYALRRSRIYAAYQIPVNVVRHERNHRRADFHKGRQNRIKRHIRVNFVLRHALYPKPFAASPDIPVAELVNKILKKLRRFRNFIILKIRIRRLHNGIQS